MENLSKENFWNALYIKFPTATKAFCEWIDAYKAKTGWTAKAPDWKFHDLPLEMQAAVINKFLSAHTSSRVYAVRFEGAKRETQFAFEKLEKILTAPREVYKPQGEPRFQTPMDKAMGRDNGYE